MNVGFRKQAGMVAVVTGMMVLSTMGARPCVAQMTYENPLRPARPKVTPPAAAQEITHETPAASPVRASVTSAPVRLASAEQLVTRKAVRPQPASYDRSFTYGSRVKRRPTPSFVPRHAQTAFTQSTGEPYMDMGTPTEIIEAPGSVYSEGEIFMDPLPAEGEIMDTGCCDGGMGDCGGCDSCGGYGSCGSCGGCGSCGNCCLLPCPTFLLERVELMAGVQGFTGPLNRGESGSFGFHYGVNWGVPAPCLPSKPIGMQLGYRGVSSNYSGASFTNDSRNQGFITAGLFRRVDWGLQGGVVVDILHDDWYYDTLELTQMRGELGWVFRSAHELGFHFTASTKNNAVESALLVDGQTVLVEEIYEPTDLMSFYYRRRFEEVGGGYGRLMAGFTGNGEGLIGADVKVPLTVSWALQGEFTYLIPKDGSNRQAHLQEAWNVGISLVWYPGVRKAVGNDYFRPLFDVAHNGTFIVRPVTDDN